MRTLKKRRRGTWSRLPGGTPIIELLDVSGCGIAARYRLEFLGRFCAPGALAGFPTGCLHSFPNLASTDEMSHVISGSQQLLAEHRADTRLGACHRRIRRRPRQEAPGRAIGIASGGLLRAPPAASARVAMCRATRPGTSPTRCCPDCSRGPRADAPPGVRRWRCCAAWANRCIGLGPSTGAGSPATTGTGAANVPGPCRCTPASRPCKCALPDKTA